jgi:hypothetical protein
VGWCVGPGAAAFAGTGARRHIAVTPPVGDLDSVALGSLDVLEALAGADFGIYYRWKFQTRLVALHAWVSPLGVTVPEIDSHLGHDYFKRQFLPMNSLRRQRATNKHYGEGSASREVGALSNAKEALIDVGSQGELYQKDAMR